MAERWFVAPGWRGQGSRVNSVGVKYIDLDVWEGTPQIAGVARRQWRFDHFENRWVLVRCNGPDAALDQFGAQSDVLELPDMAQTIGGAGFNRLRAFLNSIGIDDAPWLVRNTTTIGQAIDEIIELSTFTRRFHKQTFRSLVATRSAPNDVVDPTDFADAVMAAESLNWGTPAGATIGDVLEWGRTRGRIDNSKRRN